MKKEWTVPEITCLYVEETEGGGPYVRQDAFESDDDGPTIISLNRFS